MFICLFHRQNTFPCCTARHSMCKNDHNPRDACTTLLGHHNYSALLDTSCCRSSQSLSHCAYLLTSLSRQTWTHDSGLYAVQQSRRTPHGIQSVLSENIPHPKNRPVNSNAELSRYYGCKSSDDRLNRLSIAKCCN